MRNSTWLLVGVLWLVFIALFRTWTVMDRTMGWRAPDEFEFSPPDEHGVDSNKHGTPAIGSNQSGNYWEHETSSDPLPGEERNTMRRMTKWTTDAIFQSKQYEATIDDFLAYNHLSPLNDKTLPWNSTGVRRDWIRFGDNLEGEGRPSHGNPPSPPAMLLLTDAGWNHADPYQGRRWIRSKLQRRLLMGLLQHRWFHPTAWKDLRDDPSRIDPNVRYYVFADMETCGDKNYPNYGFRKLNLDKLANRDIIHNDLSQEMEMKQFILSHPLFAKQQTTPTTPTTTKLIIFDCNGYSRHPSKESQWWNRWIPINNTDDRNLVVVSMSARHDQQLAGSADMGLPPPAIQPCVLSQAEREAILNDDCSSVSKTTNSDQERPYFFTFSGNFRHPIRQELQTFDGRTSSSGGQIWITTPEEMSSRTKITNSTEAFRYVASRSQFGAAPRGDNLFSFRFTELLSCGTIPVVYADDWVFPFRRELLTNDSYVVVVPERRVNESLEILEKLSPAQQCRLRKRGLEVYEEYMKDGAGTIRGIVETLEGIMAREKRK